MEASRREKRQTFLVAIAFALAASLLVPPAVQAAVTTIRGTVKIKDSGGRPIESKVIDKLGLFVTNDVNGAVAVRNFAGGGGFLGLGFCGAPGGKDTAVIPGGDIVTGIIVTGTDAAVQISSEATDPLLLPPGADPNTADAPVSTVRVNASNPNEFIGLGTGLTITAPLKFKCVGANGSVVVLGQ